MESQLTLAAIILGGTLTPGPNNLAILDFAARGGLRAAVSAIAAIVSGGIVLYALVHFGVDVWVRRWPWAHGLMLACGVAYLGWLGGTFIYRSFRPRPSRRPRAAPLSALPLLVFQLVNPKGWFLMASVSAAVYCKQACTAPEEMFAPALLVVIPSTSLLLWLLLGMGVRRFSGLDLGKPMMQRFAGLVLIASAASLMGGW